MDCTEHVLVVGLDVDAVLCERPTKIDINGNRVTMEFRDGWKVR